VWTWSIAFINTS